MARETMKPVLFGVLALLVVLATPASASSMPTPIRLAPKTDSSTGGVIGPGPGAETTVVADLNGDHRPDVVVTDPATMRPRALLNRGAGSFGTPILLPRAQGVLSIASGYFNGDGVVDIVGQSSSSVVLWTGNGDGTFVLRQQLASVGNGQPALAVADVNGDGLQDVIAPALLGVRVYWGTRGGLVVGPTSQALGLLSDLAVANLNRDDLPDLVVVDATPLLQRVRAFRGTGDGRFVETGAGKVGYGPEAASVGDLNGDGVDDVVTSDSFSIFGTGHFSITVLLSDGHGGFRSPATYPVGRGPVSGDVGDLNLDGKPDVVIASVGDSALALFANNGAGKLVSAGRATVVNYPQTPVIADINSDGKPDIAVPGVNALSVLLGR